jgi:hypothetical protein
MPEILIIKGLTYHAVLFKNLHLFSRFSQKSGKTNYGLIPFEIAVIISIRIVCVQRILLKLKPFICCNSTVYISVFLASTSALFFPLR